MASNNETVAEIVKELRAEPLAPNGEKPRLHYLADRFETAHRYEMNALVAHLGGNALAAKDAEIAELRECLKDAMDFRCAMCSNKGITCHYMGRCEDIKRWRKALEGGNNGK